MPTLAAAFPLLAGREAALRRFGEELRGPRRAAFAASQRRLGLTREHWFFQPSPSGDLVIFVIEGPDPSGALRQMGTSEDPFDVWVRGEIRSMFGVDMSAPPPSYPEEIVRFVE